MFWATSHPKMDFDQLVQEYNRKRGRESSPSERKRSGNPLYIDAIRAGAGLSSFVHSHTNYSRAAGEGPLKAHPQYKFFEALLGNTTQPDDQLSVLSVHGFPSIEAYHEGRRKSLARRRSIQETLEEHATVDQQLRRMTSPESWETKAASLVSEAPAALRASTSAKPVRNPWIQSFDFLKSLSTYPNYQAVVTNSMMDPVPLFELANAVAGALKERPSAFYFSAAASESPIKEDGVRAALRYITWNVLFNGAHVAGVPVATDKKALPPPFTQSPPGLTVVVPAKNGVDPAPVQISPEIDGEGFMDVLKSLVSNTSAGTLKGAADLQAYFMDMTNSAIRRVLTITNTATAPANDDLTSLDIRAEQLLSDNPEVALSSSMVASAYPYLDTLSNWVKTVFEAERDELAGRALSLAEEVKSRISSAQDAGETMWSRPIVLLEMLDLPVQTNEDLPFRPAVVSAMNRVLALVNDFLRTQGRGAVTVTHLQSRAGQRIAEKFAYATSRQMAATASTGRGTMTGIQRISEITDTAAAIAEVCVAILEN